MGDWGCNTHFDRYKTYNEIESVPSVGRKVEIAALTCHIRAQYNVLKAHVTRVLCSAIPLPRQLLFQ